MLEPIELPQRAPSLSEQVYLTLRRQIRNGTFPPDGIVELDLSEALNVSRTPVREALFQLCREKVLVKRGRGYHLPTLDLRERIELTELRGMIEPQLASMAAERADERMLTELRTMLEREASTHTAEDVAAFAEANADFREALLIASGNRRLKELLQLLDDQVQQLRLATLSVPENREAVLKCHRTVVAAMETKAPQDAARAMRALMAHLAPREQRVG